ncbi:hypothetical protein BC941DRAFT_509401 [Chlamydoabsidia padenii]|nr:hypothetical protein BC941DRAFT_509401 [Chlamydoabsidia padenii]
MFESPSHTLSSSLQKVAAHPKEYLAELCCRFNDTDLWVHKAILLSRCPSIFIQHFIPGLTNNNSSEQDCIILMDDRRLSSSLFKILVHYWYTAGLDAYTLLSPLLLQQLDTLENDMGLLLLPRPGDNNWTLLQQEAYTQLSIDFQRIRQEAIGCDIIISISTTKSDDDNDHSCLLIPAHRFILASQSTYFYAMFCMEFCESQNKVVHLTDSFFTPMVIQVMLHYLYSDSMHIPPPPQLDSVYDNNGNPTFTLNKVQKLTMKKHTLRVLQMAFRAADYLGQMKTFGQAVLHTMAQTCHDFKCLCHDCALLLPSMLSFADKKKDDIQLSSTLRTALISLYSDPVHAIEHLWSQKPFAILAHSMIPSAASMMKSLDPSITLDEWHKPRSTLIFEISEQTYRNVTKHNAIHVLHSLHLCFSKLRSADLIPTWSLPTLDLLDPILQSTVAMVSNHFDFYCVEYPILLSCVDGIGCGFSIDFLDFLLRRVLDHGIRDSNAGIIYQGIVKDLIGRQETVKNLALDDVLLNARGNCTDYLTRRWLSVKSSGGFRHLEKSTMRQLSMDIGIPYRTLAKPFDSDLLSLFSFKPKTSRHAIKMKENNSSSPLTPSTPPFTRRRSFGTPRLTNTKETESTTKTASKTATTPLRPRSHSAGTTPFRPAFHSTKTDPSSGYVNYSTLSSLSSQPLIHLLSMEMDSRRQQQECIFGDERLMDALLPMDLIVTVGKQQNRPTALTFEMPQGPTHAKSPLHPTLYNQLLNESTDWLSSSLPLSNGNKQKTKLVKRHSKWNLGSTFGGEENDDDYFTTTPMIGARVELRRRPLPTFGTIQYVGPVCFAKGTWIGLELESRLGKNNGCVSGVRYFHTDPQRGLFVKQDDFTIISIPT